jgi:DNA-binding transcriptional regulator YiaG
MVTTSALDEAAARKALPPATERRRIREEAGLSVRAVGRHVGVSGEAVRTWERGRAPRVQNLVRYLNLLRELKSLPDADSE